MSQPDLRLLRTFLVVAEELNFTRAAARLHLVQQAVSAQIRTLETQMGVRLFERTSRKVELTAAGLTLRDRAHDAVQAMDDAVRAAVTAGSPAGTRVRCGHTTAAGWSLLPAAAAVLEQDAPDIELSSTDRTPVDLLDALRSGGLDIAVGLALEPVGPGLAAREVWRGHWELAVAESSRYAEAVAVDLRDLADADWMCLPRETHPGYWSAVKDILNSAGIAPAVRPARIGVAGYTNGIANGAVGIAPASRVAHPAPGVVLVPILPEPPPARYSVVWNPDAAPAHLDTLLAAFAKAGAAQF